MIFYSLRVVFLLTALLTLIGYAYSQSGYYSFYCSQGYCVIVETEARQLAEELEALRQKVNNCYKAI